MVFGMLRVTRGDLHAKPLAVPIVTRARRRRNRACVLGFLAARPYPQWYLSMLQDHKHLRYELWGVVAMAAPVALVAAAFGVALARIAKNYSMTVPLVAVGAWLFCRLVLIPVLWDDSISAIGEAIHYFPASMIAGIVLPALALLFTYRQMTRAAKYRLGSK
jgi:hypothetical protein